MKITLIPYICALSLCASIPTFSSESADISEEPSSYYASTISELWENTDFLYFSSQEEAEEFSGRYAYQNGSEPESSDYIENNHISSLEDWTDDDLIQFCRDFFPSPLTEDELLPNLPRAVELDIPEILQKPELPTGCESVALAIALKYKGYELEKTTIAEDYLVKTPSSNFIIGYVGDPFSEAGMGVYPPGLLLSARNYLEDQEAEGEFLRNLSGTPLHDLFSLVSQGEPVIIWASMYMSEPEFSDYYASLDDLEYQWYFSEHCMVLSGYDLREHTVTISDPLEGIVTRDLDEFNRIFERTGMLSAIV